MTGLAACSGSPEQAGSSPSATTGSGGSAQASAPPSESPTGPTASATKHATERHVITIEDFDYSGPGAVRPGATITVRNNDDVAHTVTVDKGDAFDIEVAGGESATFQAPKSEGSYAYHCEYHANMHGTLKVK
ncbi:MAG: cupredoxin domain-containing protein [Streptosporangiales bacterium]